MTVALPFDRHRRPAGSPIGRTSNTDMLQLERAGIAAGAQGRLQVNQFYQTEVPHIYAAGDVIGFPALASTAMEQG